MTGRCVALADEWEDIERRVDTTDEIPDGDECDAATDRQCAIESELAVTPADLMADAIAKARILAKLEWQQSVPGVDSLFLAASLLADLERMAGVS